MKILLLAIASCSFFSIEGFSQIVTEAAKGNGIISSHVQAPALIRGPYLQVATDSTIEIRWRTDLAVGSAVRFGGSTDKLESKIVNNKPKTEHIVKVHGLKPNTKYYYSIGYVVEDRNKEVMLQGDENNFFYTLPIAGTTGDFRIGFFGDPGSLSTLQYQVRDEFEKYVGNKQLNALVILGDIAYNYGLDAEYQAKFFNVYKGLLRKYPMFTTPGNHDYHDDDKDHVYLDQNNLEYFQNFSMPADGECGGVPSHNPAYYAVDIGNVHLLVLDSFGAADSTFLRDTSSIQMQWMIKDLEANKNKDWIVVATHFPPYTMGSHNSDGQFRLYKIRQNVVPILERYGVDLFVAGHSHLYERSRLMENHYGKENTFDASVNDLSSSSGLYDGSKNSCPYIKGSNNRGTVYIVNGSSSEIGGTQKNYPHDAMYYSDIDYGGANVLEVRGNRLDWKWICQDGIIRDQFTMMKNVNKQSEIRIKKGESVTLTATYVGDYEWNNSENTKSIKVTPRRTTTFTVHDKYNCLKDSFKVIVK